MGQRTGWKRRVPKYLLKQNGKLRRMPPEGRCQVCGASLTKADAYYVCSSPRCSGSPLIPAATLSALARRLIRFRDMWPELVEE